LQNKYDLPEGLDYMSSVSKYDNLKMNSVNEDLEFFIYEIVDLNNKFEGIN